MRFLLLFIITSSSYAFDHGHKKLTQLLKEYTVAEGKQTLVDYKKLKKNSSKLDKYLNELSSVKKETYKKFSGAQKLAFLINAYNAFTLKLIIDHYPVKSIKDIEGGGWFRNNPWNIEFINLLGKKMTLDNIEHDTIRENFKEPRIHFAVNCASLGCPSLFQEAFTADKLSNQLDKAATHFLNNEEKNRLDVKNKKLYLSKIFDWYAGDFKTVGLKNFVSKYMKTRKTVIIKSSDTEISYLDYNWKLNELK